MHFYLSDNYNYSSVSVYGLDPMNYNILLLIKQK